MKRTVKQLIILLLILIMAVPGAEAAKSGVVKGGKLRVRDAIDGNLLGTFSNKTEIIILEENGKWLRVDGPAIKNGWVMKKYVTVGDECHPHAFDPSMEVPVHQAGQPMTRTETRGNASWAVEYPVLEQEEANTLITDWVEQKIDDIIADYPETESEDSTITVKGELKIQYSSYLTSEKYESVLLYGTESRITETPAKKKKKKPKIETEVTDQFFYGFNVDTETGEILTAENLYQDPDQVLGKLEGTFTHDYTMELGDDLPQGDSSWLETGILTPEGLTVVMAAGVGTPESFGMHKITLPYQSLKGSLTVDTAKAESLTVVRDNCLYFPINPDIDPTKPMVALTFDDGPGPATDKILQVLQDNHCHATFCVVGSRVELYPETMRKMAEDGNEISCHTWSHRRLDKMKEADVTKQLQQTIDAVEQYANGYRLRSLRPPYGLVTKNVANACIKLGLTVYTWSLDTDDWISENPSKILKKLQNGVENGSIVLCHDIYDTTAKAAEQFIPWLIENGYQVVSVSEMMAFRANGMELGASYSHMNPDNIVADPYN